MADDDGVERGGARPRPTAAGEGDGRTPLRLDGFCLGFGEGDHRCGMQKYFGIGDYFERSWRGRGRNWRGGDGVLE